MTGVFLLVPVGAKCCLELVLAILRNHSSLMGVVLAGRSLAELVVAVPCHIFARWRGNCLAQLGTFIAMSAGFGVLVLSFGPGVFYLFAARAKKMMPKK